VLAVIAQAAAKGANFAQKAVASPAVRNGAALVATTVVGFATDIAGHSFKNRKPSGKSRRANRKLAIHLARQKGGLYSENTVVAGEARFVVWVDKVPLAAFPSLSESDGPLEERPELHDINQSLLLRPPSK